MYPFQATSGFGWPGENKIEDFVASCLKGNGDACVVSKGKSLTMATLI